MLEAFGLKAVNSGGKDSDPQLTLHLSGLKEDPFENKKTKKSKKKKGGGPEVKKSRIVYKTLEPEFYESFTFSGAVAESPPPLSASSSGVGAVGAFSAPPYEGAASFPPCSGCFSPGSAAAAVASASLVPPPAAAAAFFICQLDQV